MIPELKLKSSVCSFKINPISFEVINKKFPQQVSFNEYAERIISLSLNDLENNSKYIIYRNGRVRCMGLNSFKGITLIIKRFKKQFLEKDIKIKIIDPLKITNLVMTYNFNKKIDLEKFVLNNRSEYNPKSFPGVIYKFKIRNENNTALVFNSGKVIFTGFKKIEDINDAVIKLKKLL